MGLNEFFGSLRSEDAREELINLLNDPEISAVDLDRLADEVMPYYFKILDTRTRAGKVTSPFSEVPVRLNAAFRHYLSREWTKSSEISKLGIIQFSSQELMDLYNNSPELIAHIRGVEISDTHLLFDESDPNNIILRSEFAEIFSRMENLEHLGLDKIFPDSYVERLNSIHSEQRQELISEIRLPQLTYIFEQIPTKLTSLKIDTSDPTYIEGDAINRIADNFLQGLFRDESLTEVTTLELISDYKLVLNRDYFREASFFNNLENLKLCAPRCYFTINEFGPNEARVPTRALVFPNLDFLECSAIPGITTEDIPSFWLDSQQTYTVNVVGSGPEPLEPLSSIGYSSKQCLFDNGNENNCGSIKIEGQDFVEPLSPTVDMIVNENLNNDLVIVLKSQDIRDLTDDTTHELFGYIRQCGYKVEFDDIEEYLSESFASIMDKYGTTVSSITLSTGLYSFDEVLKRTLDCYGGLLSPNASIFISATFDELPTDSKLKQIVDDGKSVFVELIHNSQETITIKLDSDNREDSLDIQSICLEHLKKEEIPTYLPYPEVKIPGIGIKFEGIESKQIKVIEKGELAEPVDINTALEELANQARSEYLRYYTDLYLEGFEMEGVSQQFYSIETLTLDCCDFEIDELMEFLGAFPELNEICLKECSYTSEEVLEHLEESGIESNKYDFR